MKKSCLQNSFLAAMTAAVQLAKSIGAYVISTASTGAQQHLLNIGVDQPVDYTTTDLLAARGTIGKIILSIHPDSATR